MAIEASVVIATYKEPKTIGKAVKAFLDEKIKGLEILVIAPDQETLDAVKDYKVKRIKEKVKAGKPAALNLAMKHVSKTSKFLILSDGDVYIKKGSVKKLLECFEDEKIGAVTGNPVSRDSVKNKFGFWAHMLTRVADLRRKRSVAWKKRLFCSGYLFAIRKELFPHLPPELLSEDGYISHKVYEKGFRVTYSPESKVYVSYPTNFKDWITQKKRSAGGYNQNRALLGVNIRSFGSESKGALDFFKYVSNLKQMFWLLQLFVARVYLWAVIYRDINVKKKSREEIWVPVESTK